MPNITEETSQAMGFVNTKASGFASQEEAMDWQLDYAYSWPMEGYGTAFTVSKDEASNTYTVTARRYHSCD